MEKTGFFSEDLTVGQEAAGQRLDKFLLNAFLHESGPQDQPGLSRAALQKAIQSGHCLVDGQPVTRPAQKLLSGQKVNLALPQTESGLEPDHDDQREIGIIWQDENLLVCNKPAGLTVHPCPSCSETTLVNLLLARFPVLASLEGLRPGIVHRLDRDTSGLLLVALNERTRLALSTAFAERRIHKQYLALVSGLVADGESRAPLGRDQTTRVKRAIIPENQGGKPAHTAWHRLWSCEGHGEGKNTTRQSQKAAKKARSGTKASASSGAGSWASPTMDKGLSLLGVRIFTGRTHQIRVHLASHGHPLLGDRLYAPHALRELAPRQMLHAWKLEFEHPLTGQAMSFCCPPPPDFAATAVRLARRMQRLVVTGNPGSGKSAFCRQLSSLGLATVSADAIVADLYARDGEVTAWLCQHYGQELAGADGGIDKTRLMELLQADQLARREIESLVHALVRQEVEAFFARQEESGAGLAVAEIPLYPECQWKMSPRPLSLYVWCPQVERHARIRANRGWDADKIAAIDSWQWPDERKRKACDLVVENTGSEADLASEAERIVKELARLREAEARRLENELDKIWNNKI